MLNTECSMLTRDGLPLKNGGGPHADGPVGGEELSAFLTPSSEITGEGARATISRERNGGRENRRLCLAPHIGVCVAAIRAQGRRVENPPYARIAHTAATACITFLNCRK